MLQSINKAGAAKILKALGGVCVIVLLIICFSGIYANSAEIVAEGTCGKDTKEDMSWTLDAAGNLIIRGHGAMKDFFFDSTSSGFTEDFRDYWESIQTADLGNGITTVGKNAFFGCKNLREVRMTNSITKICESAFRNCESISTLNIPDSVKIIEKRAFEKCTSLGEVYIANSINKIFESTFKNCESLLTLNLPDSVELIESYAFENCTSLTKINIRNSSRLNSIGFSAFRGCKKLESFSVPNAVSAIPSDTFKGCNSLKKIVIPNSVKSIGSDAFSKCHKLESISIPNTISVINERTFEDCDSLKKIVIPNSVVSIDTYAFLSCDSLSEVTLNDGLKEIVFKAFMGCNSLTDIVIPATVESIGECALYECKNLKSVTILNKNCSLYDSYGWFLDPAIIESATIYGYPGSTAENYAKKIGNPFVALDETKPIPTTQPSVPTTGHTHVYGSVIVERKATCTQTGLQYQKCKTCGQKGNVKSIPKTSHAYKNKVVPATLKKNGKSYDQCAVCGKKANKHTIAQVEGISIGTTQFIYDGKAKKPNVYAWDTDWEDLQQNKDFKVKYSSGRKDIGTYRVTVTLKSRYKGSKTLNFQIVPDKVKGLKQMTNKTGINIRWNPVKGASYYQVYRLNPNTGKYQLLDGYWENTSYGDSNIRNESFTFRIRAVAEGNDGRLYYGKFSKSLHVDPL